MEDKKRCNNDKYTNKKADAICSMIALGQSVNKISKKPNMPSKSTIFNWLRAKEYFREQYELAKEFSADVMEDECLDIADDGTNDFVENEDGTPRIDRDHIQRSRLRIETRLKLMGQHRPKKYGKKVQAEVEHRGIVASYDISADENPQEAAQAYMDLMRSDIE